VRELENIIERAVVLAKQGIITTADLPLPVRTTPGDGPASGRNRKDSLNETLDTVERGLILEALKEAGGIQTRAATRLGISERVFRYKLKKYRIKEQEP
jgi:DNA-binding NtrC family response regulator